jgi:hypothetical protein
MTVARQHRSNHVVFLPHCLLVSSWKECTACGEGGKNKGTGAWDRSLSKPKEAV